MALTPNCIDCGSPRNNGKSPRCPACRRRQTLAKKRESRLRLLLARSDKPARGGRPPLRERDMIGRCIICGREFAYQRVGKGRPRLLCSTRGESKTSRPPVSPHRTTSQPQFFFSNGKNPTGGKKENDRQPTCWEINRARTKALRKAREAEGRCAATIDLFEKEKA